MRQFVVALDAGHGDNTPGKRSPDGKLREYKYARERVTEIASQLENAGVKISIVTPEDHDISLPQRVTRINNLCKIYGSGNVLAVSFHLNAAGNGTRWMTAGGWCAYTSIGQTRGDVLADHLYQAAEGHLSDYAKFIEEGKKRGVYDKRQVPIRKDMSDGDPDQEANFYILKNTQCPACLVESMFQDNRGDYAWLQTEVGKKTVVDIIVDGILSYINSMQQ